MKKMKIDWNNLIDAFSSEQEDYKCYLDANTGAVVWKSIEVIERVKKEGQLNPDDQSVEVPNITSREGYELMMDFIEKVYNQQLKSKLMSAVQGKGAFRRFKEVLTKFPHEQEKWYLYQDAAHTKILFEWLYTLDIESTNTPQYRLKVGDRVKLEKPPFDQELMDQILFTADFLVGNESKAFLGQILKGSKAKNVKSKNGEQIPGYGSLAKMTIKNIDELINKAIQTSWLEVNKNRPKNAEEDILEHSRKGWDRLKEIWSQRLYQTLNEAAGKDSPQEFITLIMGRHREIRQQFLDFLFKKAEKKHIPIIEAWKNEEVRKFKKRLQSLLRKLRPYTPSQKREKS
ncbi:UPF0158 family protein [candidate division CSSED10-310 bacterium]|uniref:UPF0158 family protein n=1 Tax=candidate division CSSED10-310 bacterium TaxID=2855610 RepID=A0ABV6YTZ6_UNCC1